MRLPTSGCSCRHVRTHRCRRSTSRLHECGRCVATAALSAKLRPAQARPLPRCSRRNSSHPAERLWRARVPCAARAHPWLPRRPPRGTCSACGASRPTARAAAPAAAERQRRGAVPMAPLTRVVTPLQQTARCRRDGCDAPSRGRPSAGRAWCACTLRVTTQMRREPRRGGRGGGGGGPVRLRNGRVSPGPYGPGKAKTRPRWRARLAGTTPSRCSPPRAACTKSVSPTGRDHERNPCVHQGQRQGSLSRHGRTMKRRHVLALDAGSNARYLGRWPVLVRVVDSALPAGACAIQWCMRPLPGAQHACPRAVRRVRVQSGQVHRVDQRGGARG
jgi:hypothetical protein